MAPGSVTFCSLKQASLKLNLADGRILGKHERAHSVTSGVSIRAFLFAEKHLPSDLYPWTMSGDGAVPVPGLH